MAVENTYHSFKQAVDLGFSMLETDLRITQDDQIVLLHDSDLKRIADLPAKVCEVTMNDLKKIKLPQGSEILSFDEFMKHFAGLDWVFDIKPEEGQRTIKALIKWIEAKNAKDYIVKHSHFLFWNTKQKRMLLEYLPNASIFPGEVECWQAGLSVLSGLTIFGKIKPEHYYSVPPKLCGMNLFKKSIVDAFHRKHAKTIAYLPKNEQESHLAVAAGFDYILTDYRPV